MTTHDGSGERKLKLARTDSLFVPEDLLRLHQCPEQDVRRIPPARERERIIGMKHIETTAKKRLYTPCCSLEGLECSCGAVMANTRTPSSIAHHDKRPWPGCRLGGILAGNASPGVMATDCGGIARPPFGGSDRRGRYVHNVGTPGSSLGSPAQVGAVV